jgi:hypothetical protein
VSVGLSVLRRMCRRDLDGLIHWAFPPFQFQYRGILDDFGARDATNAFCDVYTDTYGDLNTVPQAGPTCLQCLRSGKA